MRCPFQDGEQLTSALREPPQNTSRHKGPSQYAPVRPLEWRKPQVTHNRHQGSMAQRRWASGFDRSCFG